MTESGCTKVPFKLGLDVSLNNTDFWTAYIAFVRQFAKECNATLIGPLVHNNDPAKEFTNIKTLVQQGAQALIVNPADSAAIAPALAFAASKQIPVISDDVAPTRGKVYMIVRADNVLYGRKSCEYIAQQASKPGTIAMLEGNLASLNGKDRTDGCKQILASKYPKFKIAEYATKWDTPTAVNAARTAIATHKDLVGIYVQWSPPEDGIIAALKSAGKFAPVGSPDHIVLVGNDGTPHEHDLIRQGQLDATISQPADLYAKYSVLYAQQALAGKQFAAGQKTDHNSKIVPLFGNLEDALQAPLVTKANVDDPKLWGNAKR